jgi:hypothetical protein
MILLLLSQPVAALRRLPIKMVNLVDGQTGQAGLTVAVEIRKNGGAWTAGAGVVSEPGNTGNGKGSYAYEATAAELDTLGPLELRATAPGARVFNGLAQVIAQDINAATDTLLSIRVEPPVVLWRPGADTDRQQFTAWGTYSYQGEINVSSYVTWSSSTPATATISNAPLTRGQATAASAGNGASPATTVITASVGSVSGTAALTVDTDRDATSNIRVPRNRYQWSLGPYGQPDGIYLCQEAAGNLADSGLATTPLTANASPLYQQTVPGWSRKGVGFTGGTNQRFAAPSGVGPNPVTTDVLWCWLTNMFTGLTLPHQTSWVVANGTNNIVNLLAANGWLRRGVPGQYEDDKVTRPDLANRVVPIGILNDNENDRVGLFTDVAKTLVQVFAPVAQDGLKGVGGIGGAGTAPGNETHNATKVVYGWFFAGTAARKTDAQIKAMYEWLGFTVGWS